MNDKERGEECLNIPLNIELCEKYLSEMLRTRETPCYTIPTKNTDWDFQFTALIKQYKNLLQENKELKEEINIIKTNYADTVNYSEKLIRKKQALIDKLNNTIKRLDTFKTQAKENKILTQFCEYNIENLQKILDFIKKGSN